MQSIHSRSASLQNISNGLLGSCQADAVLFYFANIQLVLCDMFKRSIHIPLTHIEASIFKNAYDIYDISDNAMEHILYKCEDVVSISNFKSSTQNG